MSTGALTKIHAAVKADHRAQVEAILKSGGDVNNAALDGRSALHVAAESDSVAVAKLLLAKGAVISAEIKGGWRALHVAASKNNSRVAKLLASKGASLDAADELGRLPLHIAVQNNSVDTIKVLISSGASLETALKGGWRPLHIAANKNYGGVAKILLAAGASADCPDEGGWTPLHVAASRNSVAVAKQLLAKGASAESESEHGWKPLHAAANINSVDVAKVLLSKGAAASATTKNGQTALHLAAQKNNVAIAELLISKGISVEAKDKRGTNALHFAAESNSAAVVELLLSKGANPEALDKIAGTPLHLAAMGNSVAAIELLVPKYRSVDLRNKYGQTPLHFSAQRVAFEAGRLLVQKGAKIQALDKNDRHPLMALVLGDSKKSESNEDRLNFAYFLVTHGATWSESDHKMAKQEAAKRSESGRQSSSLLMATVIATVCGWSKQRELGVQNLTALPIEVFERGELDIQAFFSSITSVESTPSGESGHAPSVTYRKKLCVVGPSKWGKTSLIKSLTTQRATMEDEDNRTMGIDLFPWTFESGPETRDRYSVTIWDFAGQDEYRSAHSLFYSKRTTYLVCINLKAYEEALESAGIRKEPGKYSAQMDNFVRKCFHDPIQITVGSEFFGKYGVHIQTGLSLFASVIPDMLGKNAIDTIISACSTELDRAVHVYGLVDRLDLPDGGYQDMEKIRTLSPDDSVAILRDLLTVYDPTFDTKKMSKISKLECGIVHESGDCLWAYRDEILERSATIRFRHDYTKTSFESHGPSLKVDAAREPHPAISEETGELWPSDAKDMKNGSSPLEKDQGVKCAIFRLLDAQNLRKVPVLGKQRPYCKWKLINSDNQEISSGRTSNSSPSPNWSNQSYTIDLGTLKGSKLNVAVKTPRLFGRMSTTIATGSYLFQDDLKPDQSQELCAPLIRDNSPAGELRFTKYTSNS